MIGLYQLKLQQTPSVTSEEKLIKEIVAFTEENQTHEWDLLLERKLYWNTLRITACVLRLVHNSRAKKRGLAKINCPLTTEEILRSRYIWIRKVQRHIPEDTECSGWRWGRYENSMILKCVGRIRGYEPIYLENGLFVQKLIRHIHEQIIHLELLVPWVLFERNGGFPG